MTLNLPLLHWFWFVEYCRTSPNKNKSPNVWHITSVLVCCILGSIYSCQIGAWKNYIGEKYDANNNLRIIIAFIIGCKSYFFNLKFKVRGHSQTTLTRFWLFLPPTTLHWLFLPYEHWQKVDIFGPPTPLFL